MRDLHTPECIANHCGLYAIEPRYLSSAVAGIKAGTWPMVGALTRPETRDLYAVTPEGIAILPIAGPMMKGRSKYAHANTLDVRRGLRAATRDEDVGGILLLIDSPGGMVAGTQELADDVRSASDEKPVWAHGDDLMASAAYWMASQASRITANRAAEVGSIGTLAVVEDSSEQASIEGITVHVVSTGELKGAFTPGAPVTDAQLDYLRERVEELNGHFLDAVGRGRMLEGDGLGNVATGRVWGSVEARRLGLIDSVQSMDDTLLELGGVVAERRETAARRDRMRRRR